MKKVYRPFMLFIILVILGTVPACGGNADDKSDKLSIVTTLYPQYDFAKQIAGDNAEVTLLLTPGAESHSYEPTPKDILKIQNADIFIYIGGTSEVWADDVLSSAKNSTLKAIRLMDNIEPVEALHDDHEEESEHSGAEYDEHIFTSLKNSRKLLDDICDVICEKDSKNADTYRSNAEAYGNKISELDRQFSEMINSAERKTVVFGDRFPFVYFARDYDLDWYAAFTGCSSETEASAATISSLIDIIKKESVPVVFYIEFSSQTIADKIAGVSGVKTALLHSCHNISKEELESGISYVELMSNNFKTLSEALN